MGFAVSSTALINALVKMVRLSYFMALLLAAVCVFLAYLNPYHAPPWRTFQSEWLAALAIIFLFFLALYRPGFRYRDLLILLVPIAFFVFGYTLLPDVAPVVEQVHLWTINALLACLAYLAGRSLFGIRQYGLILGAILAAGAVSVFIGVLQWSGALAHLQVDQAWAVTGEPGWRIVANIGQPNNLGTLLLISLVILLSGLEKCWSASAPAKAGMLFLLLILTTGIALTASRAALLGLLVVTLVATLSDRRQGKPWPMAYFAALALVCLVWLLAPYAYSFTQPEVAIVHRSLATDSGRMQLWSMVLHGILEKPWTGWGPGGQAVLHQALSPEFGAIDYQILNQSHSFVLDILVVFGVVLGGGILVILAVVGRAVVRHAFANERHLYLLLCLPIVVHGLLEYPHYYGFFLWPLCLFIGAAMASEPSPIGDERLFRFRPGAFVFLLVALAIAVRVAGDYLVLEDAFRKYAKKRYSAVNVEELDAASSLFPGLRLKLDALKISHGPLQGEGVAEKIGQCATYYPLPDCLTMQATIEANDGQVESGRLWLLKACRMFGPETCEDKLMRFNNGLVPGWAKDVIARPD